MRVALISWESMAGPAWTETAQIVSETARALTTKGANVHVFTGRGPGQGPETAVDGVTYHRCPHDADPDPRQEAANFARAVLSAVRTEENENGRFAALHGFEWPSSQVLGELRRDDGRVTVWSFLHPHLDWRPPTWLLEQDDVEARWSYHPDDFADRVMAPSDQAKEAFVERWGMEADRVMIAHPAVDPGWAAERVDPAGVKAVYGFDTFDPVVLFIGALTRAARPSLLLDAMPRVIERHPRARVVFAGDGELADFLVDRARVIGIEQATRVLPGLAEADLARLCKSCDVVCLPQRSDALLSPVQLAWAASKPVVITAAHAASTFVRQEVTGYLAEESVSGLAAGLLWMFEDFDRCRWIGANGRGAVDDAFGWPAVAGQLMNCYRETAAQRRLAAARAV